jgi:GDPmannose 4,6-dehydratase
LGDINIEKDWGYAKDYVYGMYLMAQQNIPQDYILSSGRTNSLREFIEITAKKINLKNWEKYINIDNSVITRKNNIRLFGDCSLAKKQLNWSGKNSLNEIIEIMIQNELNGELK